LLQRFCNVIQTIVVYLFHYFQVENEYVDVEEVVGRLGLIKQIKARRSTRQSSDPAASHQQLINTSDDDHVGRDRLLSRVSHHATKVLVYSTVELLTIDDAWVVQDLRATKPVCVIRWGRFIVPSEVDEVTRDEIFLILEGIAFDG
ncbi:hypothetical protein LINPERHAP2_LOCUS32299, partial [Linum perenne]